MGASEIKDSYHVFSEVAETARVAQLKKTANIRKIRPF